jgi:hypothetical protein
MKLKETGTRERNSLLSSRKNQKQRDLDALSGLLQKHCKTQRITSGSTRPESTIVWHVKSRCVLQPHLTSRPPCTMHLNKQPSTML